MIFFFFSSFGPPSVLYNHFDSAIIKTSHFCPFEPFNYPVRLFQSSSLNLSFPPQFFQSPQFPSSPLNPIRPQKKKILSSFLLVLGPSSLNSAFLICLVGLISLQLINSPGYEVLLQKILSSPALSSSLSATLQFPFPKSLSSPNYIPLRYFPSHLSILSLKSLPIPSVPPYLSHSIRSLQSRVIPSLDPESP